MPKPSAQPPSTTVGSATVTVVGADEQHAIDVDVDRWCRLATRVLESEGRSGELTLTFVDRAEMADLNAEHMGHAGATDVLSFPLDADPDAGSLSPSPAEIPRLLGDVVICPAVAADQSSVHAGTLDDELALLVVHGVLHVLGHDHAETAETASMRAAELAHLEAFHWGGPAPHDFRQEQQ